MSENYLNPPDENQSLEEICLEELTLPEYRVYADGTVQDAEEQPYSFMSDDYCIVRALDEETAHFIWENLQKGVNHG